MNSSFNIADFLSAAARLIARKDTFAEALRADDPATTDGLTLALFLVDVFGRNQDPGPLSRTKLRRLAKELGAPTAADYARWRGYMLVDRYAPEIKCATDVAVAATCSVRLLGALAAEVDSKIADATNKSMLALVTELCSKWSPKAKGMKGAIGTAGVLAGILREANAVGHTKKQSEEHVRKAVENSVKRFGRKP